MANSFHVHAHTESKHLKWSKAIPPIMMVPSGAEISWDLHDGGNNQIRPDNADTALSTFDLTLADPGHGPVFVEGAEPGDVLKIEFLELHTADYGWTAILPGFGILADDDFAKQPRLKMWDLSGAAERGYIVFRKAGGPGKRSGAIHVPFAPFLGLVGVAPADDAEFPMVPPLDTGGNIDTRHVGVGSVLYLPVRVPGALLSLGDGHAAQGDGEVCGTAVETPMRARVRVEIVGRGVMDYVQGPVVVTAPRRAGMMNGVPTAGGDDDGREFVYLGVDADLREAARKAVRGVLDWLGAEKGLDRYEAYMLASVAGSLRMCEVVDMPNYVVGFSLPLGLFVD